MKLKKYIHKVCCFYASDWHLTVMLLPYINSKIEENSSIYMKCENNIEEKMNILLNKLDIKNKRNIMNINWNNKVQEDINDDKEKIFIVSGKNSYIENTNEIIEKYYINKDVPVKIINCYELTEEKNLKEIIQKNGYTQMLNTKGESKIDNKNII
ncbi:MAG: hypothetical protein J6K42_06445 [Clostridia bacterium]|nr:hypothetical protein [Clostridia bacterium]